MAAARVRSWVTMPAVRNVLIVGGGIAGMTLSVALKRAGITCEVVEIDPQWTVAGVGIALGGPALRALRVLGVLEPMRSRGFRLFALRPL